MKKQHGKKSEFSGTIKFISCSPHGDPEGVVLSDGSFIKIPPHSLLNKELFKVGASVSGFGEMIGEKPNRVFHHVKLQLGKNVLADDSVDKEERESLKEQHKRDLKKRKDAPSKKVTINGKLVAVGTKPKGEVDRLIFDDGTSVHVPKEIEISLKEIEIGDSFEIAGEARMYDKRRFVKAERVRRL